MGLFNKLISIFTGSRGPAPQPTSSPRENNTVPFTGSAEPRVQVSESEAAKRVCQLADLLTTDPLPLKTAAPPMSSRRESGITVTFTGSAGPSVQVSDSEVAERVRQYDYVLTTDPSPLKTADQWWDEATHKRRLREGSARAYAWLAPFVLPEAGKLEQLQQAQEWGPHWATTLVKALRALIRERRKAKQPTEDLLQALYGACILADLSASMEFEGMRVLQLARYVDVIELQVVRCNYATMGYQCIESIGKTDVKWLVEAFGEPPEHQSFDALWPHIRRNAISRYCWEQLRRSNESSKSLGWPQKTMQDWLNELVKRNIGYQKEWRDSVATRKDELAALATTLETAWLATREAFIVADLETTGLNAETDEVLELAALQVDPSGVVTSEFSMLVRVTRSVPDFITKLTGITQADVDREGRPLTDAMKAFMAFVGSRPVFFHNAPFDAGFLNKAGTQTGLKFTNPMHDTLPITRSAWPSLGTYQLAALAEHVGALVPTHRALADTKAALAVLMAARAKTQPLSGIGHLDRETDYPGPAQ